MESCRKDHYIFTRLHPVKIQTRMGNFIKCAGGKGILEGSSQDGIGGGVSVLVGFLSENSLN